MLLTSKNLLTTHEAQTLPNPVLLSCECKGTTTFPIYQMFGKLFSGERHNEPTQYADA